MWNQPKYTALQPSDFFEENGSSSRPLPAGTVPFGGARTDQHFYAGKVDGEFALEFPSQIAIDEELLHRGQERYQIFCSPCHGATGNGQGMVVQRGFKVAGNYHEPRLKESAPGYFYDVITNGFGTMYSYASRIPPEDRWAIVAYIRALQLSQAPYEELTPDQQAQVDAADQEAVTTNQDASSGAH
jgi:mono/diheme cytochrome c family protein